MMLRAVPVAFGCQAGKAFSMFEQCRPKNGSNVSAREKEKRVRKCIKEGKECAHVKERKSV